ncbi:MAG: cyclic nucleotide-binding/CBS domain-containing protein [Candidatus Bathyarchaeia archaeon]
MKKPLSEQFPRVLDRAYWQYKKYGRVSEIMTPDPFTVKPEATMAQAGKIMGNKKIGSLLVEEHGKTVGIVAERDLLTKIIARKKNPSDVKVKEVSSTNLVTINPAATIKMAARTMIREKGKLLIMSEGRAEGIITASDLIRTLPEHAESALTVEDFMTKPVTIVDENVTVEEAAVRMGKGRIGSLLVAEKGTPIGIFTERDFLTKILAKGQSSKTQLRRVLSRPLKTIPVRTTIHNVARKMARGKVRRLPVVEKGKILGIVTARDLVEAYAR